MPGVPIGDIVALVEGEFSGDRDQLIIGVKPLGEAGEGELTLLASSRMEPLLAQTRAAAVLVPRELDAPDDARRLIRVADPHLALARVLQKWFAEIPRPPVGVSALAQISPSASIGMGARIGAYAVIGDRATIGPEVTIFDGCHVGPDCVVGEGSLLYPNVTVYHGCLIGRRCILHSGVVVGSDGYGFATSGGVHHKIPQVGIVRIEDDVEVGAGTTIDRATLGETVIGEGTKIDNLVQIGHNVRIGKHCLLVAQVGIAGSTEIGDHVVFGGQSGAGGHLKIASNVKVGSRAAVMKSWEEEVTLSGTPARPLQEHLRAEALIRRLPKMQERIEKLEQQLDSKRK
jgi:UDP-3-O-[3-hydroxymyristoyl] glucosamine N-acyltransferase